MRFLVEKLDLSGIFATKRVQAHSIGMVDQMFPPLATGRGGVDPSQTEFTSFHYWRPPLLGLDDITKLNEEEFEFP